MQKISEISGQSGVIVIPNIGARNPSRLIKEVAYQRESRLAEMDSDLVGPSRGNRHFQKGRILMGKSMDHSNMTY